MSYLRGFLPWIAFSVLSSLVGWQWGALAALAVTTHSLWRDRRAGIEVGAQILDLGGAVFFLVLTVLAFTSPHSPLEAYDGPLSSAWLAVIAVLGLAVGRPFTLAIARRSVPDEVARHPMFLRFNTVVTGFWAAGFGTAAVLGVVCVATGEPEIVRLAVQVAAFVVPAVLTRRYVARARAERAVPVAA
ncbi:hypothetical protein P0W64_08090 [Tsukamurella sp. 8F]|uniref:hypothetical protein n=1 Tax=unclassified Tsukamurella TaxID=2633480 RepID=UPI0023B9CBA8|nr:MULTISPECIES: hypothetical protein [unclassified Tsukamurella]MDF0528892.1 hypothetical protein [Tsukamurella sp. 8J]MDF0586727.1 hypothetical protein [Tsukamurella sp. 8F]